MANSLYRQLINLTEEFEGDVEANAQTLYNFSTWLSKKVSTSNNDIFKKLDWDGKKNGRSAESIINTSLIHLYRYAKVYSKIAINQSPFSTIDEVIYLINLLHKGDMTKKELIDLNIHEKSTGIQIINRLISAGFVSEAVNANDRRSKHISISSEGKIALESNMDKIRAASKIVVGNLNDNEKLQLIRLLQKLDLFHQQKLKQLSGNF
ncbi:MAG: winged helix-turn-helix transcriptional regulator [Pyrinomonadaceae bacterium]|nr:winged helix-turn-helix transcriptional regulator [Sphingobacteriaceae bacterium]